MKKLLMLSQQTKLGIEDNQLAEFSACCQYNISEIVSLIKKSDYEILQ
jgi:hypothetical protein